MDCIVGIKSCYDSVAGVIGMTPSTALIRAEASLDRAAASGAAPPPPLVYRSPRQQEWEIV